MKHKFLYFLLFISSFPGIHNYAQDTDFDTSGYLPNVIIDSVIITANQLDVPGFIRLVKNDTSFYKAFRSMRLQTYNAMNDIRVYNKSGKNVIASLKSETKQIYRGGCRTMNVLEEEITGDFYKKNGDYNYYTAEMYASLFFTKGKVCGENEYIEGNPFSTGGKSGIEKRKAQLKQLIFNPGSRVDGIPFFGKKSSIFTDHMADKYNYTITDEERNGEACYKFDALPLPEYKNSVVINRLTTWFRKSDMSIVSRTYSLSYHGLGYDFDVDMAVNLKEIRGKVLPVYISYRGNWSVTTQGRERVHFTASFHY